MVIRHIHYFRGGRPTVANRSTMSKTQATYPNQKVVIADDHDIFRHGLKTLLLQFPFIRLAGEARNGIDLVALAGTEQPHIIFVDLHMPQGHGPEAITEIKQLYPHIKIVVLSFYNDALTVDRMMKLGAHAYLSKNISINILGELFAALLKGKKYICEDAKRNMANGQILNTPAEGLNKPKGWYVETITEREREILQLVVEGKSNREIGEILYLSKRTIETHREKILKKLNARNTAELIAIAHQYNLL